MRARIIKLLLACLALLPLPLNRWLGWLLGKLLFLLPNDMRRVATINLDLCFPELNRQQRKQLLKKSLEEAGKTILEMGPIWLGSRSRFDAMIRSVEGEHYLTDALSRGRGAILVAPHLGNWEVVGLYSSTRRPITSLYRPPRMAGLAQLMRHARERFGATLVPTDATGIRALYKALGRGELVGILPDQEPSQGNGLFAPFFGHPAYTMVLLPRLAIKTGAPLIYCYAERVGSPAGFRLRFSPGTEDLSANTTLEEATVLLNAGVEQCIRNNREQYLWGYKRFRTRPADEPPVY